MSHAAPLTLHSCFSHPGTRMCLYSRIFTFSPAKLKTTALSFHPSFSCPPVDPREEDPSVALPTLGTHPGPHNSKHPM